MLVRSRRQHPRPHSLRRLQPPGGDLTTRADYVIVGSGLTGATMASLLHRAGHRVHVVERRAHVGGNVHDFRHESGIRVQAHGPHYFRTSSEKIWNFVRRFGEFFPYEAKVLTRVDGRLEQWPVSGSYIRRVAGDGNFRCGDGCAGERAPDFESAMLARLPAAAYERFVREYTEKQWGVPPAMLNASLARRVRVHWDDDPRLTPHARHQALPRHGYARLVERMLAGIPVDTGVDYLANRSAFSASRATVFTGSIDEYFGFALGRLGYRAQRRETEWVPGVSRRQPVAQVNEPQHCGGSHIRTIEWVHLMHPDDARHCSGTVLTRETPFTATNPDEFEYPVPDEVNAALFARYEQLAARERGVLICGRLGEYRYLDMDQAIGRAMMWAERLLRRVTPAFAPAPRGHRQSGSIRAPETGLDPLP